MSPSRAIGVDVGGTKILAGVVDREGVVHRRDSRPTPVSSEEELLAGLDAVVESLLGDDVAALGFGIPSQIDQRSGRAVSSVHIPLAGVDFRDRMGARFHVPVGVDNDGNAAAIAEWKLGAGRGASNVVLLTLGTGIGGGLILDGKPFRGAVGAGAELGHMVLQYGGPPCPGACTGHGHFEAFAAGSAADAFAERRFGPGADARRLVAEAEDGDEGARADLAELGRRLGAGIGSLVNIFNPELVIVGGGFGKAGAFIVEPAQETLAQEALPLPREIVRVVPAELGPEAGMVGAALVGLEALDGTA
ncbi:MAG TPA: ROK family protein [Gaiellaceae bacterium]|nr:ROK family protein [Gaiellaceae bacterium]